MPRQVCTQTLQDSTILTKLSQEVLKTFKNMAAKTEKKYLVKLENYYSILAAYSVQRTSCIKKSALIWCKRQASKLCYAIKFWRLPEIKNVFVAKIKPFRKLSWLGHQICFVILLKAVVSIKPLFNQGLRGSALWVKKKRAIRLNYFLT
jgi:hypothetical protein